MKAKIQKYLLIILVFIAGIAVGLLIGFFVLGNSNSKSTATATENTIDNTLSSVAPSSSVQSDISASSAVSSDNTPALSSIPAVDNNNAQYVEWDKDAIYNGGDKILYNGKIYKAKWWTQNETPGKADVWEDTMETPNKVTSTSSKEIEAPPPTPTPKPEGFKVVGYYPAWKPEATSKIRYDKLTHIIYAFAIPTSEGGLRPLENPETAKKIISDAHSANVKVLIAIGGWSYNEIPLEPTFAQATSTEQKRKSFADAIIKLCDDYGFDGVDMDWEHPRVDGGSSAQYEALMLDLASRLHTNGKILTSAVLSGVTADGNIYYDSAAHTDKVLLAVDWINVMAYDGGDGERHSSYDFATNCVTYWRDNRKLSADKVVLGVPFYARPSWASYADILASNSKAAEVDHISFNGMDAWYNSPATITKKTAYAKQNAGGIMIWEITQDTSDKEKSLMSAIK